MAYSWKKGMSIDDQWESWQEHNPLDKIPDIDTDTLKETIIKDLSYVSQMDVKEYTLYQNGVRYTTNILQQKQIVSLMINQHLKIHNKVLYYKRLKTISGCLKTPKNT